MCVMMKNCNRIKDGNGMLVLEENKEKETFKEYFEDLYNVNTG